MRTNVRILTPAPRTHEGAVAARITPLQQLRRSVLSCLLWEKEFYEDGMAIADRILDLASKVRIDDLAMLALEARTQQHLRHVPLLLLCALVERGRGNTLVQETIEAVVQRADEPGELLALYWRNGKKSIAAQLKKGLARAIAKFDAYQLSKYGNSKDAIRLRDVLFLTHAKPPAGRQPEVVSSVPEENRDPLFEQLADDTLPPADTWEVALSGGASKKDTFTRLLQDEKLGYLALLRNLRNMVDAGVDDGLIRRAILARKGAQRVLPFRFVAAARIVPRFEVALDKALLASVEELPALDGDTIVLVDVSGSMDEKLSAKSDLKRIDAAAALASIVRVENGDLRVFTFSNHCIEVPPRRGMAGIDAVIKSQMHGGTNLGAAVSALSTHEKFKRLIVITDEQSHDRVPAPTCQHAYMINVASAKNGVGYGAWKHIDGFSENVLRWIREVES